MGPQDAPNGNARGNRRTVARRAGFNAGAGSDNSWVAGAKVAIEVVRPSPSADNLFRLRHLAGVARDLAVARNPQASGAAYVLLFREPLERFVPVHA
jgi:hypothetical protein